MRCQTNPFCSALILLLTTIALGEQQTIRAEQPNIVVILVDDMGYGDPGCYNPNSKIPTPNIDQLSREGMMFSDAHAPGALCHLSRYGLMTGEYPWRTQVKWNNHNAIKEDRATIASFLKSRGYDTSMVGKWHLGFKEPKGFQGDLTGGPVDRGFDQFFGIRASTDIPPYFYIRGRNAVSRPTQYIEANQTEGWSPIQGEFWRAGGIAPDLKLEEVLPRFTKEAKQVIQNHEKSNSKKPLFLYLAYPAPHTPWLPSKKFVGKSKAGMYGDFMAMVDDEIGQVISQLKASGLDKETLLIFSSDNGPTWYEKDVKRFGHDSSGPLRGMKADAWECGHRVPFIVRWPSRVEEGSRSDQLICFTDLFATFADLLKSEISDGQAPDSLSFLPTLLNRPYQPGAARNKVITKSGGNHYAIRSENWKLITGPGSGGFSKSPRKPGPGIPPIQLYDLAKDIGETKNLYLQFPQKVEELKSVLKTEKN